MTAVAWAAAGDCMRQLFRLTCTTEWGKFRMLAHGLMVKVCIAPGSRSCCNWATGHGLSILRYYRSGDPISINQCTQSSANEMLTLH